MNKEKVLYNIRTIFSSSLWVCDFAFRSVLAVLVTYYFFSLTIEIEHTTFFKVVWSIICYGYVLYPVRELIYERGYI